MRDDPSQPPTKIFAPFTPFVFFVLKNPLSHFITYRERDDA